MFKKSNIFAPTPNDEYAQERYNMLVSMHYIVFSLRNDKAQEIWYSKFPWMGKSDAMIRHANHDFEGFCNAVGVFADIAKEFAPDGFYLPISDEIIKTNGGEK